MKAFESEDALRRVLVEGGVSLSRWTPDSVAELWKELSRGECSLVENPFRRQLRIAKIQIVNSQGTRELIEEACTSASGEFRRRSSRLSEKLFPGENPQEGAKRAILEELGVKQPSQIEWLTNFVKEIEIREESPSYPKLRSEYEVNRIACKVYGLPQCDFWTAEAGLFHLWKWIPLQNGTA
jgi:hypothetical protein